MESNMDDWQTQLDYNPDVKYGDSKCYEVPQSQ